MTINSDRELANTREKLQLLEESYEEVRSDLNEDAHLREVTMKSLKRLINQLKEEITRFEARQPVRR